MNIMSTHWLHNHESTSRKIGLNLSPRSWVQKHKCSYSKTTWLSTFGIEYDSDKPDLLMRRKAKRNVTTAIIFPMSIFQ